MKFNYKLVFAVAIGLSTLAGCKGKKDIVMEDTVVKNDIDSVSYALGLNIGQNLKQQGIDSLNTEALAKALTDVFEGNDTLFTMQEAGGIIQSYLEAAQKKQHEVTIKAGEAFLEANKAKEGVVALPSGLQYKVLTAGSGKTPTAESQVTTHYHGTLIDGTVFDSSYDRGQPATFGVTQVIKGWTEALQLMKEGDVWELYIPYDLAYGANPRPGGPIKPYDALIFKIELISVQ